MAPKPAKDLRVYSVVHTGDGKQVPWPFGAGQAAIYTPLLAEVVEKLNHPDFATRCVATSKLTYGQLLILFREGSLAAAKQCKLIGRRIIDTDSLTFAEGLGRKKIVKIYFTRALYTDRDALIEELMRHA